MKNKLYIFGCSYSALFPNSGIKNAYKDYRNSWPKHWSEILSESLNLELVNLGLGGSGNDEVFERFCKQVPNFKKGDVVLIGWTYLTRIRVVEHDRWQNMSPGFPNDAVSQKTLQEMCVNRAHSLYEDELHNRELLLNDYAKLKGINLFLWNAGFQLKEESNYLLSGLYENQNDTFINIVKRNGGTSINEETNGIVNDNHLGELGNKVQADIFYNILKYKLNK